MRDLKFRAWDKRTRAMHMAEEISFVSTHDEYGDEGGLPYAVLPPDTFDLMPSTGIKDVSGTEIFEGDIGRINLPDIGYVNCVCEWDVAGFRWKKINELQGISANPSTNWSLVVPYFEVIGKIYENPELLDRKAA